MRSPTSNPQTQANHNPDTPSALNNGFPKQANRTSGRGFFTAPLRAAAGHLVRALSPTFDDVYSQPRLFYNSLLPVEQQFLINAMRFETAHITSPVVVHNVLVQLNRVSHDRMSNPSCLYLSLFCCLDLLTPSPPTLLGKTTADLDG